MKVVSYCLWGDNPKYQIGAIVNAQTRVEYYPEWVSRFYIHKDVSPEVINIIKSVRETEVVILDSEPNWGFSTARFKVLQDPQVTRAIIRDCDSRLSIREVMAVREWERDGTALHVMKDHIDHAGWPILAGMWGFHKKDDSLNINKMLKAFFNNESTKIQFGVDQVFLKEIWELYKDEVTIHDEYFSDDKPFPYPKIDDHFVGKQFLL